MDDPLEDLSNMRKVFQAVPRVKAQEMRSEMNAERQAKMASHPNPKKPVRPPPHLPLLRISWGRCPPPPTLPPTHRHTSPLVLNDAACLCRLSHGLRSLVSCPSLAVARTIHRDGGGGSGKEGVGVSGARAKRAVETEQRDDSGCSLTDCQRVHHPMALPSNHPLPACSFLLPRDGASQRPGLLLGH